MTKFWLPMTKCRGSLSGKYHNKKPLENNSIIVDIRYERNIYMDRSSDGQVKWVKFRVDLDQPAQRTMYEKMKERDKSRYPSIADFFAGAVKDQALLQKEIQLIPTLSAMDLQKIRTIVAEEIVKYLR